MHACTHAHTRARTNTHTHTCVYTKGHTQSKHDHQQTDLAVLALRHHLTGPEGRGWICPGHKTDIVDALGRCGAHWVRSRNVGKLACRLQRRYAHGYRAYPHTIICTHARTHARTHVRVHTHIYLSKSIYLGICMYGHALHKNGRPFLGGRGPDGGPRT